MQSPRPAPNQAPDRDASNVKVVVRVRGFVKRERERGATCLISMNPETQVTTLSAPTASDAANAKAFARNVNEDKSFTFDKSFWSHNPADPHYATQEDVYKSFAEEFLEHNFDGYNTCIFAYGQTGSGKSYTMMGSPQNPGLIPQTCRALFRRIHDEPAPNTTYNVHASYFEIYNEHVRDLLVPRSNPPYHLKIRESPIDGAYVQGLTDVPVKCFEDVEQLMNFGDHNRTTASTKMNDVSSRSHAVFTIQLKQIQHSLTTDETLERSARLRLVDLAGSERAKTTEATGQRLLEGGKINKSLTTLARVIAALADPRRQVDPSSSPRKGRYKETVVPYRDSVLTWLLRDSLGGNSQTAMVACISPCDYDETLSTLRYANQAKRIRTNATANVDAVSAAERDAQIAVMTETIRRLQTTINATRLRREREEANELEDYQKQVEKMQRMMEETRGVGEAKIRALTTEVDELRTANEKLVGEIGALRRHLGLVVEELRNPIIIPRREDLIDQLSDRRETDHGLATEENSSLEPSLLMDESGSLAYSMSEEDDSSAYQYEGSKNTKFDHDPGGFASGIPMINAEPPQSEAAAGLPTWAQEINAEASDFLESLALFRRKIGDDYGRFNVLQSVVASKPGGGGFIDDDDVSDEEEKGREGRPTTTVLTEIRAN